jgi:AcrR family transcriptional regulator
MNMGRPKAFDEARALNAAMAVFWQEGYNAASLQSLLKATGLSKSSLYLTFGSKQDLFIRSFDQYKRNMVTELERKLAKAPSTSQFIEDFLLTVIKEATPDNRQRKGCMIINSAHELSQKDTMMANAVSDGTDRIAAVFAHAIEQGKASGELTGTESTDALTGYLMTGICGLRTMVMAGADAATLKPVIQLIMKTIS